MNRPSDHTVTGIIDINDLIHALGIALRGFFNVLMGSPEVAAVELMNLQENDVELALADGRSLLQIFINRFEMISRKAGWTGSGLLASAMLITSWIEHSGDRTDELMMLLGLQKLLDAMVTVVGTHDLDVAVLQTTIQEELRTANWSLDR